MELTSIMPIGTTTEVKSIQVEVSQSLGPMQRYANHPEKDTRRMDWWGFVWICILYLCIYIHVYMERTITRNQKQILDTQNPAREWHEDGLMEIRGFSLSLSLYMHLYGRNYYTKRELPVTRDLAARIIRDWDFATTIAKLGLCHQGSKLWAYLLSPAQIIPDRGIESHFLSTVNSNIAYSEQAISLTHSPYFRWYYKIGSQREIRCQNKKNWSWRLNGVRIWIWPSIALTAT